VFGQNCRLLYQYGNSFIIASSLLIGSGIVNVRSILSLTKE